MESFGRLLLVPAILCALAVSCRTPEGRVMEDSEQDYVGARAAGAATGRRGWASGLATSVALVPYLVDALAGVVDWLEPFDRLSPFHWAIGNLPLVHGLSVGGTVLLIGSSAALLALAVHQFDRRDLGV